MFREEEHPRANDGKFTTKGTGKSARDLQDGGEKTFANKFTAKKEEAPKVASSPRALQSDDEVKFNIDEHKDKIGDSYIALDNSNIGKFNRNGNVFDFYRDEDIEKAYKVLGNIWGEDNIEKNVKDMSIKITNAKVEEQDDDDDFVFKYKQPKDNDVEAVKQNLGKYRDEHITSVLNSLKVNKKLDENTENLIKNSVYARYPQFKGKELAQINDSYVASAFYSLNKAGKIDDKTMSEFANNITARGYKPID